MLMDMEIRPGEVRNRVTWVGNLPADHSSQDCRVHYQLGRLDRCLDRSGAGSRHLHQCCTCTVSDLKRREGLKNKPSRNPSSHWVPLPWKELGKQEVHLDQKYLTKKSPKQCMTPSLSRQEGNPPRPPLSGRILWFGFLKPSLWSFPLKNPSHMRSKTYLKDTQNVQKPARTYWLSLARCCWALRRLSEDVTDVEVTKAKTKLQNNSY